MYIILIFGLLNTLLINYSFIRMGITSWFIESHLWCKRIVLSWICSESKNIIRTSNACSSKNKGNMCSKLVWNQKSKKFYNLQLGFKICFILQKKKETMLFKKMVQKSTSRSQGPKCHVCRERNMSPKAQCTTVCVVELSIAFGFCIVLNLNLPYSILGTNAPYISITAA